MAPRLGFPRTRRVRTPAEYKAVYDLQLRQSRGPLVVYAKANCLRFSRLGLSVSRRVGTAARRNRIRRLLREAFRHMQHDLPLGYDWVVVVKPHEPPMLADYQRLLSSIMVSLHTKATRARDTIGGRSSLPPPVRRGTAGEGDCERTEDPHPDPPPEYREREL